MITDYCDDFFVCLGAWGCWQHQIPNECVCGWSTGAEEHRASCYQVQFHSLLCNGPPVQNTKSSPRERDQMPALGPKGRAIR